jgi:signal transduction histidine kinase
MERIFDPYFSTKNTVSQRGLGMGLAICYAVIKKHGGYISVNSEPGKGTSVEIYLPAFM